MTLLVVAATELELDRLPDHAATRRVVCGVGPVEAALATARALAEESPAAILHIGVAGARREAGIGVGSLVVGREAVYEDLLTGWSPTTVLADPGLLDAARAALGQDVPVVSIGTTGTVGGGRACPVEAMEGFAVLRAAELAGVPAVEVRAVSNLVEEDRADWRIEEALDALAQALPALVDSINAAMSSPP